jgi:transcriptional regulator with GAF, ATPase, and Fis domain
MRASTGEQVAETWSEETSPGRRVAAEAQRNQRLMRAGAVLAIGYAVVLLVVASLSADLGFFSYQGGPVIAVDAGSAAARAGLRTGDLIVAIDGARVATTSARSAALHSIEPGQTVVLEIARDGAEQALRFTVARRLPLGSAAGVALALVLLAISMVADRSGRHDLPRAFFRQTVCYTVFLAGTFSLDVAVRSPFLLVPWIYSMALAAPMTCRFMLRFPAGRRWFSWPERALLYGPPLVLATAISAIHLTFAWGRPLPPQMMTWAGAAAASMALTYLAVGAIARARRLRVKAAEIDARAARWLRAGGILMVLPLAAAVVAAARDINGFIAGGFGPYVAIAMVGGSACVVLAMTRMPFGELDRLWRKSSGYALATGLAAAMYLVVIGLLGGTASILSGGDFRAAVAATLVAAILFGPVRAAFQRMVDERFARDRSRARRLLREAAETAVATLDIDALQRGVVERVRTALAAEGVAMYVAAPRVKVAGVDPLGGAPTVLWCREIATGTVPIDEQVAGGDVGRRLDQALTARAPREIEPTGAVLAVPLAVDDRAPAALVVAPRDGEKLDEEETELLQAAAAGLVVALGNARAHRALRELSERLRVEVENAEKRRKEIARLKERLEEENRDLVGQLASKSGRAPVIGKGLEATFELAQRAARGEATVLIHGETGAGKELVARAIHAASPRRSEPFVVVDCGAIAAGLVESALFGHERGAFTGAIRSAAGAFRAAHGGTIFLDELGELPLELQPKLLRVLQEREVQPLGADAPIAVDVRVVCGTNRDLAAEVDAGRFREDLWYRLRVVEIDVPPLRARRGDIAALAEHFLAQHAQAAGRPPKRLAPDAQAALLEHDWPGNVRELEHAMEAAAVYAEGDEIHAGDLPIADALFRKRGERAIADARVCAGGAPRTGLRETLEELERDRLASTLAQEGGNRTRAARALGMSRGALLRRLKRYGLDEGAEATSVDG